VGGQFFRDLARAGWEVYRASKAALNTMLRSFAIRSGEGRTVLAMVPGWVRTDMGGPSASLDVETSVKGMAEAIAARRGQPGASYVDWQGNDVAW
jgi:NAD(P)-dependent dehydrogenase (short-subunit alcohol dehydrogenase family)